MKSATEIISNSMTEEDPNKNIQYSEGVTGLAVQKPRWGPEHAGAKELASKYTRGELAVVHTVRNAEIIVCFHGHRLIRW